MGTTYEVQCTHCEAPATWVSDGWSRLPSAEQTYPAWCRQCDALTSATASKPLEDLASDFEWLQRLTTSSADDCLKELRVVRRRPSCVDCGGRVQRYPVFNGATCPHCQQAALTVTEVINWD